MNSRILAATAVLVVVAMCVCAVLPALDAADDDGYVEIKVTYNSDYTQQYPNDYQTRSAQASSVLDVQYDTLFAAQTAFWTLFQDGGAFHYSIGDIDDIRYDVIDTLEFVIHGTVEAGSDSNFTLGNNRNEYGYMVNDIRLTGVDGAKISGNINIGANVSGGYDVRYVQSGTLTVSGIEFMGNANINACGNVLSGDSTHTADTEVSITDCVFHGQLYMYANDRDDGQKVKNVIGNTFTNDGTVSYAFFVQGQASEVNFINNTVSGYTRGINIHPESQVSGDLDTNRTSTLISGNIFEDNSEDTKACIQLTNGTSAIVEYNVLRGIFGNAFKFHEAGVFSDTVTIRYNYVEAEYILNIKSLVEPNIESYGNILDIENPGMGVNDDTLVVSHEGDINGHSLTSEDRSWYDSDPDARTFSIGTAGQLLYLSALVMGGETFEGDKILLTGDIDLSDVYWIPIGNSGRTDPGSLDGVRYFAGDFDGQYHEIRGLSSEGYGEGIPNDEGMFTFGLFGYVSGSDIIKVTLTDVDIDLGGNSDSVGALVGYAVGDVSVSGVTVSGLVSGYDAIAGIVGRAYTSTFSISDCVNNADVVGTRDNGKVGGIVSTVSTPCTTFEAIRCYNNGNVSCEGGNVGGVVGFFGTVGSEYKITGGHNTGAINGKSAGGAVGYDSTSEKTLTIDGFVNSGAIEATSWAGGVVGILQSDAVITGVTNSGSVTSNDVAGGIVGSKGSGITTITSSEVTGGTISGVYSGGIVGSAGGESLTIDGCKVHSSVTIVGTDDGVLENGAVFQGSIAGVAVGRIREADLTVRGMSDVNGYELVSATYFNNGGNIITLENCKTENTMTWSSNSSSFNLRLVNTDLAGLEFSRTTLNIAADTESHIGKLVAGVDEMSGLLDKHGIVLNLSGSIVISAGTTLYVDGWKADAIPQGEHSWYSSNPSVKGQDVTSGLTVGSTPYVWDGSEWSDAVTITFKLFNGDSTINLNPGESIASYPQSDREGFTITGLLRDGSSWALGTPVTSDIILTPVWTFAKEGSVDITSGDADEELELSIEASTFDGTTVTYSWTGPDGRSGSGETFTADVAGTYTVTVTFTSTSDPTQIKTLTDDIVIYSVTFDDDTVQTVFLVASGGSIPQDMFPGISPREGYFSGYWDRTSIKGVTENITVNVVWIPLLDVSVSFEGELGQGMTATVSSTHQPAEGVGLWYIMLYNGGSGSEVPVRSNAFDIQVEGVYMFAVYAIQGEPGSGTVVGVGTSTSYEITEEGSPQEIFEIDSEGFNGTIESDDGEIIIQSDGIYSAATIVIEFPDGTMSLSGSFGPDYYRIVLEQVDEGSVLEGYDLGYHVETPITSVSEIKLTVHVNVPDGYVLAGASVVRQDGSVMESIDDVSFYGSTVTFTTHDNSDYWIDAEFAPADDGPINPPIIDDDDDYVPPIYVPSDTSSSDDDTVKIVACAAAAVVAAIMAAFLILGHRRE